MFGINHIIWIVLCVVSVAALTFFSIRYKWSLKTAGFVMLGISFVSEFSKIMSNMDPSAMGGMHIDPRALPFHLCSLMIFFVTFIVFSYQSELRQVVINFVSTLATMGSIAAILIPTNGTSFLDIGSYQCFVYHAGLLWFGLYLILSHNAVLGTRSYIQTTAFMLVLTLIMLYTNGMLSAYDTNFFYLTRPPMENLPYLNLDSGWYIYFLRLSVLAISLITLFHLPFIIKEHKKALSQK